MENLVAGFYSVLRTNANRVLNEDELLVVEYAAPFVAITDRDASWLVYQSVKEHAGALPLDDFSLVCHGSFCPFNLNEPFIITEPRTVCSVKEIVQKYRKDEKDGEKEL